MNRAIAIFAALLLLILAAGPPGFADETGAEGQAARGCPQQREVGAACPMPGQLRGRQATTVSANTLEIYVPRNRGTTTLRASSAVRGVQKPGQRL